MASKSKRKRDSLEHPDVTDDAQGNDKVGRLSVAEKSPVKAASVDEIEEDPVQDDPESLTPAFVKDHGKELGKRKMVRKTYQRVPKRSSARVTRGKATPPTNTSMWVEQHALNAPKPESQRTLPDSVGVEDDQDAIETIVEVPEEEDEEPQDQVTLEEGAANDIGVVDEVEDNEPQLLEPEPEGVSAAQLDSPKRTTRGAKKKQPVLRSAGKRRTNSRKPLGPRTNTPVTRDAKVKLASVSPAMTAVSVTSSVTKPVNLHKKNHKGETAIHAATIKRDAATVRQLIALGAEVNCRDYAGWTPLHEACCNSDVELAEILVAAGADVNSRGHPSTSTTPLHDAVAVESLPLIRLLLDHNADPTLTDTNGETPLAIAESREFDASICDLLKEAVTKEQARPTRRKREMLRREGAVVTISAVPTVLQSVVKTAAKKAGIRVEPEFSDKTTHVVTQLEGGLAKRTLKLAICPMSTHSIHGLIVAYESRRYLHAMTAGIWVVDTEWILECARLGTAVDEEAYTPLRAMNCETGKSSAYAVENRVHGNPLLFDGCTFRFVGQFSDHIGIPVQTLKELVILGGGTVVDAFDSPCTLPRVVPFHCSKRKGRLQCIFIVDADAEGCSVVEDGVAEVTQDFLVACISKHEITAL